MALGADSPCEQRERGACWASSCGLTVSYTLRAEATAGVLRLDQAPRPACTPAGEGSRVTARLRCLLTPAAASAVASLRLSFVSSFSGLVAAGFSFLSCLSLLLSSFCHFLIYPPFPSPCSSFFPFLFFCPYKKSKRCSLVENNRKRRELIKDRIRGEHSGISGRLLRQVWGLPPSLVVLGRQIVTITNLKIAFTLGFLESAEDPHPVGPQAPHSSPCNPLSSLGSRPLRSGF